MQYLVVFEKTETSWGAYVPDLPGCVAAGETREEVSQLISEAIDIHIEDMRGRGEMIPFPSSDSEFVETKVV